MITEKHPLSGHMDKRSPWEIRSALMVRPPTKEQLDGLAAEELLSRDRAEIYRIFAAVKPVR